MSDGAAILNNLGSAIKLCESGAFSIVLVSSASLHSGRGTYTINLYRELKKMNLDVNPVSYTHLTLPTN